MTYTNRRFLQNAKDLREDAFRNIPGLLLFYDNKVICYKKGESQGYTRRYDYLNQKYKM